MNKDEFDHAIRAAGSIVGTSELLVIGSQAAHGSIGGELPVEALRSIEVESPRLTIPMTLRPT